MAELLEYVARVMFHMFHSDVNSPESTMKYHEIAVICLFGIGISLFVPWSGTQVP